MVEIYVILIFFKKYMTAVIILIVVLCISGWSFSFRKKTIKYKSNILDLLKIKSFIKKYFYLYLFNHKKIISVCKSYFYYSS